MSITSSTYTLGHAQIDGRRYCAELHTDGLGVVHRREYLAAVGTDYAAVMTARASAITAQLKEDELKHCVFTAPWNYVLQEAVLSELAAYARELYKTASKETLVKIAARVLEWLANGRFTDAQVRAAFGLTNPQWTTLKTKMQSLIDSYTVVDLAVGE